VQKHRLMAQEAVKNTGRNPTTFEFRLMVTVKMIAANGRRDFKSICRRGDM